MIDLHLHSSASDGSLSPAALVSAAARAGLRTMALTDHDTVSGLPPARRAAARAGLMLLAGIEITAVLDGRDIHVLGYGIDDTDPALRRFLDHQRADRRRRLGEMFDKLAALGFPVRLDLDSADAAQQSGKALGRPMLAQALVEAGHVGDISEAFDRFLGFGGPAFVARTGAAPGEVYRIIREAGGVPSLAHPGALRNEDLVDRLLDDGPDAIEVYHPDHAPMQVERYQQRASARGLLVTGGSDYHGPGAKRSESFGSVVLPPGDFAPLAERLGLLHHDG